jgi:hypothetical protein
MSSRAVATSIRKCTVSNRGLGMSNNQLRKFINTISVLPEAHLDMFTDLANELKEGQCPGRLAANLRGLLDEHASYCRNEREREREIDTDLPPLVGGFKSHLSLGKVTWTPSTLRLIILEQQKKLASVVGHAIVAELAGERLCNASMLELLLENPLLIPAEWDDKEIFFFGTLYATPYYSTIYGVRSMVKKDGKWVESPQRRTTDQQFNSTCAIAAFA